MKAVIRPGSSPLTIDMCNWDRGGTLVSVGVNPSDLLLFAMCSLGYWAFMDVLVLPIIKQLSSS